MERELLSAIFVIFALISAGAAIDGSCDVSACLKQIEWPAGGHGPGGAYGIYEEISTCANIVNNGFIGFPGASGTTDVWLVIRLTGPDGNAYGSNSSEYFSLPEVGTSRESCLVWSAANPEPNGSAPDGWYNESIQLMLPSGNILDEENKTHAFQIVSH